MLTDDEILSTIAAVCNFDRAGVERWRSEALIIARAVERAVTAAAKTPSALALEVAESLHDANQPGCMEGQIRHLMQCVRDDIDAAYGDKQSHRTTLAESRLKVLIRLAIKNEAAASRDDSSGAAPPSLG
ncbi:hypothetical protein [Caballeronia sp. AZ7_KS35]|uniref:hypothetical protein n=1 Tax=Caballeronia sp. AZ7_KS35 TaxID=2921762 RepID=UPI0020285CED|nr:hypothetical protein [Caballeronia sp. AZ7_KS35]